MAITHELKTRIVSAVVLAAVVLFISWWNPLSFDALLMVASFILIREWLALTRTRHALWIPFGILYIALACLGLSYLRHLHPAILYALFAIVWGGDMAAYFVGKTWGKHKIAPRLSPQKSWEGLAGSVIASAMIGAIAGSVALLPHAMLGAFLALLGFAGDLFESSMKRRAGVKDSGNLISGHGGLFDRVDALMPCAIFSAAAVALRTMGA